MIDEKETRNHEIHELGSGVIIRRSATGAGTGVRDIEDMQEQGITSEIEKKPAKRGSRKQDERYELGEEFLGPNFRSGFTNFRDIDVDGQGKKKTGFSFNFFRRKEQ